MVTQEASDGVAPIPVETDDARCAVTRAMAVLDHKWHPVIVDRLLDADALRFNGLLRAIDGITNKTLSVALSDLEEKGIVSRTVLDTRPVGVEYALTARGRSLAPVVDALAAWGEVHTAPATADEAPD
jgi:DNA-binding HxlR family transcriptional regulator